MKKIRTLLLTLCLVFLFAGCEQKQDESATESVFRETDSSVTLGPKWVEYTYDDSERDVKFSIEYPEKWELTEQRAYDGDETRDGSPSTGITFFGNDDEIFSILAMLFSPFGVDENLFESEPFETSAGLAGDKYAREEDGRVWVYYIFDDGETLPQYTAVINMSTANYESKKEDMDAVVKTLKVLD